MGLWNLFGKRTKEQPPQQEEKAEESAVYSGMRVEVTTGQGELLFVAKLQGVRGDKA